MLIVETYIAPSEIHGLGVFATKPLKAGTLIWVFDEAIDQVISAEQLASLPEGIRRTLLSRSFKTASGQTILSRDNGVFLNHSDKPNLSQELDGSVALRDIAEDEELTEDYRLLPPGACRAFLDASSRVLPPVARTRSGVLVDDQLWRQVIAASDLLARFVSRLRR